MASTSRYLAKFLEETVVKKENWYQECDVGVTDKELMEACDLLMKLVDCADTKKQNLGQNLNVDPEDQAAFDELFDVLHDGGKKK